MVEHLPCKQGVRSSTLLISTMGFLYYYRERNFLHIEKYIVKIKLDTRFAVIKETKMVFLIAVIVFN